MDFVTRQDGQVAAGATQAARSLLGSAMLLAAMEAAWALHRKAYSYSPQLLSQASFHPWSSPAGALETTSEPTLLVHHTVTSSQISSATCL